MRVCFFARISDPVLLERVEFYRRDLQILRDLGHDVVVATRFRDIPWNADLYFVWWWTWALLPIAKAILRGKPVVITGVFDYRWPKAGRDYIRRPAWQRALLRLGLRAADKNIFVSMYERDQLRDELRVDNALYCPLVLDEVPSGEGAQPRDGFVLCIATMHRENMIRKCIAQLIGALPRVLEAHPGTKLVLAGEPGTGHAELAALVRTLGLEGAVQFLGVVSQAQKESLLQRCAVYVQPSVYEGFGLAVLEAMSCGAPIVTSPVGAIPEVVGDTALLVDGESPRAIADAVCTFLGNREMAEEFGRRAHRRSRELFPYRRRLDGLRDVLATLAIVRPLPK